MVYRFGIVFFLIAVWCSSATSVLAREASLSDKVRKPVRSAVDIRQATQASEERWREAREKLTAEYEKLQNQHQQLESRRRELQQRRDSALERIEIKEKQLADIGQISDQIDPFLRETVAKLHELVKNGLPFLPSERQQRLRKVDRLVEDPDVSVSEKFRKVMEALLIEAEYGHTIEVYQQTIEVDGHSMLVNLFRLGRISLFYQSLDRKACGHYDVAANTWRPLPASYNRAIQTAIDIGSRRRPVELLSLPLGRIAVP
jgi:FtsZ-binding cell division protein ZapB